MFTQFKSSKLNNDQLAALRGGCPNGCDDAQQSGNTSTGPTTDSTPADGWESGEEMHVADQSAPKA